jgi:hypothetical protein
MMIMDTYRAVEGFDEGAGGGQGSAGNTRRIRPYARAMRCCWAKVDRRKKQSRFCAPNSAEMKETGKYLNIAQVYERGRRYKEAEESAHAAEVLPGQARDNEMVWFLWRHLRAAEIF